MPQATEATLRSGLHAQKCLEAESTISLTSRCCGDAHFLPGALHSGQARVWSGA